MPDAHLSLVRSSKMAWDSILAGEKENILEGKAAQPENGARL